ncbi:lactate utilization protein C [Streptomyces sp. NPDC127106]|uniref:LutC/YkgG family protein n=1 Tax=Streptomyces sp. NPDC127106 TaxID=3345360 RepID=UPI0036294732
MTSREVILGRIRRAVAAPTPTRPDRTLPPEDGASRDREDIPRDYLRVHAARTRAESADLLAAHLAEYRARVHRTDEAALPALLAALLADRGARTVLVPPGLPAPWLGAARQHRVPDLGGDTPYDLDAVDSVVTGCALAIAETGTLVLDGSPDQGRRRITLVPDHHICVVRVPDQLVDSVPEALERLDPARPLTWISGPSATSDIELDRVEGVHGPRTLEAVLLTASAQ